MSSFNWAADGTSVKQIAFLQILWSASISVLLCSKTKRSSSPGKAFCAHTDALCHPDTTHERRPHSLRQRDSNDSCHEFSYSDAKSISFCRLLKHEKELMKTGVHLYEYEGPYSIHAKSMVIDDYLSIIGTYNLDARSSF